MIAFLRRKRHHILSYFIMGLCGLATLYVFAASFETVFNRDLPMVHSVNTVNLSPMSRVLGDFKRINQSAAQGNYGIPHYLKLPAQDLKIVVAPGIEDNGRFLARAAAAHYFMTSDAKNGNLGDLLVYDEKSWRTNDHPELIKAGDNIFLDTDRDWRYFYRIDSIKIIEGTEKYVARGASTSQLILVNVDTSKHRLYVAQASLINVQNVRL